jgi:hypothetical protein
MEQVARANLCLGLSAGTITGIEAQMLMKDLECKTRHHRLAETSISCIVDFDRAMYTQHDSRAQDLAEKFDELAMFEELINERLWEADGDRRERKVS